MFGATPAERFGGGGMGMRGGAAQGQLPLVWDLPAGWRELPATSMRQGNFAVDDHPAIEAYLTLLPGDAGGLSANVNRWRKQMSLPALDEAAVAALPRVPLLGAGATWVELEGAFSGMGGGEVQSDWKMAGAILAFEQGTLFMKMTGPQESVDAELVPFRKLCASLRMREQSGSGTAGSRAAGAPPPRSADQGPLSWTEPEGWSADPNASSMRLVSFRMGEGGGTECYATILGGDGGGLRSNFQRWSDQLGLEPLSDLEFDALPRIPVLGDDVPVFHREGGYRGMSDDARPEWAVLGVAAQLGDSTIFLKLIGPKDEVRSQRARFLEFAQSLRVRG